MRSLIGTLHADRAGDDSTSWLRLNYGGDWRESRRHRKVGLLNCGVPTGSSCSTHVEITHEWLPQKIFSCLQPSDKRDKRAWRDC